MNVYSLTRLVRKKLTVDFYGNRSASYFSTAGQNIQYIVQFFYLFLAFFIYQNSSQFAKIAIKEPSAPVWFIDLIGKKLFLDQSLLLITLPFTLVLLTALCPKVRLLRLLSFLVIFSYGAFQNSFGAYFHSIHFMIFVSFAFLFLPSQCNKLTTREYNLRIISCYWLVQFILLFSYTMAGIWKVDSTGMAVFWSETMMRTVVNRGIENGGDLIGLEQLVAANPKQSQILFLINLYVQLISLLVFFRPALHRLYGYVLCMFHLGTFLLLQITFPAHIVVWGLFFMMSPFAPKSIRFFDVVCSLPGISFMMNKSSSPKAGNDNVEGAVLVYDEECPFCSQYSKYMALKESVGKVVLINARDDKNDITNEVIKRGYDLNSGMVFIYQGKYYYGSDALNIISILSSERSGYGLFNKLLFSRPLLAKILYPVLKFGRRITLMLLGVKQINKV